MIKKYRVVFLDLQESKERFKEGMGRLGVSSAVVDHMIQIAPVILKGDMTLGDARQYAGAVLEAGGRVNIQEHGLFEESKQPGSAVSIRPLEHFTMCPECGFKQLKGQDCVKCGSRL